MKRDELVRLVVLVPRMRPAQRDSSVLAAYTKPICTDELSVHPWHQTAIDSNAQGATAGLSSSAGVDSTAGQASSGTRRLNLRHLLKVTSKRENFVLVPMLCLGTYTFRALPHRR